ncbi:MAG: 5'-3' exonuclease H3TH domain-containing protein [Microgenomates group bacterium]|jgi:DNA polymerase-1|nr:hypothetical protein [Candidatus Woesebacteria bacterium]MBP6883475.1 hypothetical protein [Candidatus Woesebacteria bacterium]QQR63485.1 MAG: hypothetical protein IPH70_03160 [Candidatus Roizmanbacteria bacterium]
MDTLLIIDGNAIMHRAFHALPPFKTKTGVPTQVIYGFFGMLGKALELFKPTHVAICFDTPKKTFRQKLLKEYQAQRPEMADDFKQQIPLLQNLIDKAGIFREEQDGLEADDVIGTIAQKAKDKKMRTLILTGDKDIMQLVNHHVFVISPKFGLTEITLYDEDAVMKKLGVMPSMIPDYKALVGDPSDNYPGAKGIGPKSAITLLEKFHTVENLLEHVNQLPDGRQKDLIESNRENIILSKKLAVIVQDADIEFNFDKAKFDGFAKSFKDELEKYEMKSLIARLFKDPSFARGKAGAKVGKETSKPKRIKVEDPKDQIGMF